MNMVPGLKNADLGFKFSFLFKFLILVVSEKMLLNTILVSGKGLLDTNLVSVIVFFCKNGAELLFHALTNFIVSRMDDYRFIDIFKNES